MSLYGLTDKEKHVLLTARECSSRLKGALGKTTELRALLKPEEYVSDASYDSIKEHCAETQDLARAFLENNGTFLSHYLNRKLDAAGMAASESHSGPQTPFERQAISAMDEARAAIVAFPNQLVVSTLDHIERQGYLVADRRLRLVAETTGWIKTFAFDQIPMSGVLLRLLDQLSGVSVEGTAKAELARLPRHVTAIAMLDRTSIACSLAAETASICLDLARELDSDF